MKRSIIIVVFLMLGAITINYIEADPKYSVTQSPEGELMVSDFVENVSGIANEAGIQVTLDGEKLTQDTVSCYLSNRGCVMMPLGILRDELDVRITYLDQDAEGESEPEESKQASDETIQLEIGETRLLLQVGSAEAYVNDTAFTMQEAIAEQGGIVYVPILELAGYVHVKGDYSLMENALTLTKLPYEEVLPAAYDMRSEGRVTPVRNQGRRGNCWAYAAVGALETVLLPGEELIFSANHMSNYSGYAVEDAEGGDYTMAVAYLARWDGPVLQLSNNGDETQPVERTVQKHLEEAVFIQSKDYRTIKDYIYNYGAVVSSIYINLELQDEEGTSRYYNDITQSYYCNEEETTNHDIVIIGWDDNYPKENFTIEPEGNGAFLCKNSWGTQFGDGGYFYISYYDTNIGVTNTCYTKLEPTDNFDYIYQSDRLGWVGELGFDCSNAYFANIYETHEEELLEAVSFYATDVNTTYRVYVVPKYQGQDSLKDRVQVAEGSFSQAGYYTVHLEESVPLSAGTKYAVIVYIDTPGSVHPVAIEYNAVDRTATFDITDGESYVSLFGESWTNVEAGQNANVCLKAFTKINQGGS